MKDRNKTIVQFFEWYCPADSKHWSRFAQEVPALLDMGITAAWLPPAYKGTKGAKSEGYDVYDIYDLGEFDQKGSIATKYGTKEEYITAVSTAREAGMEIYIDVVLNHMGGAEEKESIKVKKVNPDDRTQFISEEIEIEAFTRFQFPGRGGRHSDFKWDHRCFTGTDHAAGSEETAIYSIINEYGHDWEPMPHAEKGNFDYLILNDIETRNPAVREELKKWIKWYYDTVPFDGVRLDAVKHMNPSFFIEWLDELRNVNPSLFAIGEFWLSDDISILLKYIEMTGKRMSLFDAPLHHNFSEASKTREAYDLRTIFDNTLVGLHPELAVTFVDNHDTQPLQSLEEYTEGWFRPHAYAMILLREGGYPCIFYPNIYGTCYQGKNKQEEDCHINLEKLGSLQSLLKLRKDYAYGGQKDYFDAADCIGWTRSGIQDIPGSGCVVLISNNPVSVREKQVYVGKELSGKVYYDFLQSCEQKVVIDDEGNGIFLTQPSNVSVWVQE